MLSTRSPFNGPVGWGEGLGADLGEDLAVGMTQVFLAVVPWTRVYGYASLPACICPDHYMGKPT